MEDEVTFRTSVGGYRKDEVLEYIETMNDKIFSMKKERESEAADFLARIQDLEALLRQEAANSLQLAEEQKADLEAMKARNESLHAKLSEMEEKWKAANQECEKVKGEKHALKEKLGREILRLRAENQMLAEKLNEAEKNVGSAADYETVRNVVSEVQYKIAEYVNIINKTQQSLAETYQGMNGIKKKIASQMEKEAKQHD